jgi:hypothetical protein
MRKKEQVEGVEEEEEKEEEERGLNEWKEKRQSWEETGREEK